MCTLLTVESQFFFRDDDDDNVPPIHQLVKKRVRLILETNVELMGCQPCKLQKENRDSTVLQPPTT